MPDSAMVLNASFYPLGDTTIARAIRLVRDGRAEIIRARGELRSVAIAVKIPEIIRLLAYVSFGNRKVALTKSAIIERDSRMCQYCGTTAGRMTVDHVMPASRGGSFSWENLVAACRSCNALKDSRTPAEARMKLRRTPKEPGFLMMVRLTARGRRWVEEMLNGTCSIGEETAAAS